MQNQTAPCPNCKTVPAGIVTARGEPLAPKPRDYILCPGCLEVLVFNDDLTLRMMEAADVLSMTLPEQLSLIITTGRIRQQRQLQSN